MPGISPANDPTWFVPSPMTVTNALNASEPCAEASCTPGTRLYALSPAMEALRPIPAAITPESLTMRPIGGDAALMFALT